MAIEKTYTMIKPDGVRNRHIGEIVNRFERAGLTIERMELGMVSADQAKANYAEHEGKPFYEGLISYITSGPVVKMVVSGRRSCEVSLAYGCDQSGRGSTEQSAAILVSSWTRTSFMAPILLLLQSARLASSSKFRISGY